MRVMRKRCLGLDVHKKQITAHLRIDRGSEEPLAIREVFGTMPDQLDRLVVWIVEQQVQDIVMESTSVYWMHLYDRFESVAAVAVVNASHVKKVPGRKTDVIDAEWLSELHAHGLLRASFVPPKEVRELRQLTRYRTKLIHLRTGARNRTIKLLETAGIKLSSVVSDSFGATGRAILDTLAKGPCEPAHLASLAKGSLQKKMAELERALRNPLTEAQRNLLSIYLDTFDAIDAQVLKVEESIEERTAPLASAIEKLDPIPGINRTAAITLLAETGCDMSAYRSAGHLTAIAGLAPGNSVSSDRRRRVSVRKGNVYLRRITVQMAWAASRQRGSFLSARFRRLHSRIGRNKAIIALARQLLVLVYKVLSTDRPYEDLGAFYHDQKDKDRIVRRMTKRLNQLGYNVEVRPQDPPEGHDGPNDTNHNDN